MKLQFVSPETDVVFGNLEFAGQVEEESKDRRRINGASRTVQRRFKVFSDVQAGDNIEVVIPITAKVENFAYMQPVKLVNPKIRAEGYAVDNRGYVNYIIEAENIVKA